MTSVSTPSRRSDVDAVFQHLANLFTPTTPSEDFLTILRRAMNHYGDIGTPPALTGVRVTPVLAGGVPAEWVVAAGGSSRRRIVYVHGGGWAAGGPDAYRALAAELARRSGAAVLVVDYRLAPEHVFPAGLDDCSAALAWAASHGPDGAQDALSLTLAGDSSGGNLAAATCLQAVTSGARVPDRLVLIAGVLDGAADAQRVGRDDPVVTAENVAGAYGMYTGGAVPLADPRVSPVRAPHAVLKRFPPTLIQVSGSEYLLADSRRFAQRLEEADVRVSLSVWPGLPHVWHVFLGQLPDASQALQEIADFSRGQSLQSL
ncbi:alpha/beta hydrolase [Reyranella sp. CPCC 100927]|uniref:alpha/beta hydrolase n=1 Tax=Reyranella sp. CPCC 100927 TaxID=2599616 RepID=UPI0011B6BAF1|nr:alpha/beta hydrolase [Reyranella sp. CPCC 100927]TWT02048.1 alpha/beta hydrolase [Reyranella sp. CPCC 100927]